MNNSQLTRSDDKMILGVAGGLAQYFNIDATIVRLVFAVLAMTGGGGVFLYVLLALLMPESMTVGTVESTATV